jgi:hypothetical protein
MKPHRFGFLVSVCVLAYSLALADTPPAPAATPKAPAPAAKPAAGPVAPEAMNGLSWDGLTPEQKTLAVGILNENSCDCGCGMKLAVCRRDDAKCTRSLGLSTDVIGLVKSGKGRDEIVKSVLSPPSKYVAFAMTQGKSPSVGPKDAKVTIYHYTDYQ